MKKMTKLKGRILYPNCSEYIFKLGVKKSEIPYIKKRVNELFSKKEDREYLFERFLEMVDVPDVLSSFIETENVEPYNKITGELLAKRNQKICPFCKEVKETLFEHIKKHHREEIKSALRGMDEKEYHKLKRELILEGLE